MEKLMDKKTLTVIFLVAGIIIIAAAFFLAKDDPVEPEPKPDDTTTPTIPDNDDIIIPINPDDPDYVSPDPSEPTEPTEPDDDTTPPEDDQTPEDTSGFPKPGDGDIEQKILLDFTITTTQQEKIIENIEQGSTFTISKNFQEKTMDRGENGKNLRFLDQEAQRQQQIDPWIAAGCVLDVFVNENPDNLTLNQWSTINLPGGVISQKTIAINGMPAKLIIGHEHGLYNVVHILNPANSSVHEIVVYSHNLDPSSCIGEFNKVVESYSFTNI